MSNQIDDGGPAFPRPLSELSDDSDGEVAQAYEGMSLRDYFAAKAMQGCLAYSHCNPNTGNYHENSNPEYVATTAYCYANAMLAARNKGA